MFLKRPDAELLVSSFGAGPRTIVSHGGWVGSGELWIPPFEILSRTWRTVTYDHRGTGATRCALPTITFAALVADLFAVMDALGIDQCVVAGESAGAAVVLEAVLQRPDRFSGLVLVDGRYTGQRNAQRDQLIAGCRTDFPATMGAFVNACVPEDDADAERAWGKQIVMRSSGPAAIQLLECMEGIELESRLGTIGVPTLILHGSKDVIAPLASSRTLAELIPNARLSIAEGAGHVPTVTRPEWVAAEIEGFFGSPGRA